MNPLLERAAELFRDRAISDTEIAAEHAHRMQQFCEEESLGDEVDLFAERVTSRNEGFAVSERALSAPDVEISDALIV